MTDNPVALITGSAKRLGAFNAEFLHRQGFNIIIHYHHSVAEAQKLADRLNKIRSNSAVTVAADLCHHDQTLQLADTSQQHWQRLDLLINNASSFYPTPVGSATPEQWDDLYASNARAPFFLSQALAPALTKSGGSIVNMIDTHVFTPLKQHTIYCMAKASLLTMTRSLAKELAPSVRVNGIAPGVILWPDQKQPLTDAEKQEKLEDIPLKRIGTDQDIAQTLWYLINASYVTGQVIAVDGGRSL